MYPSHVARLNIRPRMVQSVTIDMNSVVGAPLDIPSGLIFDAGNVLGGCCPLILALMLMSFVLSFWSFGECSLKKEDLTTFSW